MAAHPHPVLRPVEAGAFALREHLRWRRLPLVALVGAAVTGTDLSWKATALAAGHQVVEVHAPTSLVQPAATLLVGVVALVGVLFLPWLCLPGALLVVGGIASNVASLALWRGVPNPLRMRMAGGVLNFNLADLCVWGGCLIFLAAAFWSIYRMPAERFG